MKKPIALLCLLYAALNVAAQELSLYEKKELIQGTDTLRYRILYPENFAATKKYPLLVFLHGSGERGHDNEAQLTHGAALFLKSENRKAFQAIIVFPQCPEGLTWNFLESKWDSASNRVQITFPFKEQSTLPSVLTKKLINELIKGKVVDTKRIYVAGLSLGGFGTFDMIERYPGFFAAAIPICGGGNTSLAKRIAGKTAVWIFHGSDDPSVDVKNSRNYYKALKQLKADVKYTEYPGVGHTSWFNAFAEPDLLIWLLSKKKKV